MAENYAQLKMTKAEIIENISDKYGLQHRDIHNVIDAFCEEVKHALSEDRVIELRGFGTFRIRTKKGRERARNPKTGEIVPVPTHGVAVFRPGRELKELSWNIRSGT